MRKRYIVAILGAVGAGAVVRYFLSDEDNRENIKDKLETINQKVACFFKKDYPSTLEEAGIPDQVRHSDVSQMENANMVSEGSQYGVHYYNEVRDENDPL